MNIVSTRGRNNVFTIGKTVREIGRATVSGGGRRVDRKNGEDRCRSNLGFFDSQANRRRRRRWTRGRAIEGSPAGVNYIGPTMSMVQMIGVERRVKNYEQRRARIPGPSINRS